MYSVVLVTMLATGDATPSFHWHGCHGCYRGCHSYCGGCWSYCHSYCHGCSYYYCHGCSYCWTPYHGCHSCGGVVIVSPGYYSSYGVLSAPAAKKKDKDDDKKKKKDDDKKKKDDDKKKKDDDKKKKKDDDVSSNQGSVVVDVAEGATLYVDGERVPLTGRTQSFNTPSLADGQDYYYTMKAVANRDGKTVSQTKRVTVRAGETTRVAFTDLQAEGSAAAARVTVKLPAAAKLFVNEQATPLTSAVRTFNTPALETGKDYFYTMKAEVVRDGKTVTETQKVAVAAGKEVTVEFKKLDTVQTAGR